MSHDALDCIKHFFVRRTGSKVVLVGALLGTAHALPHASLWLNHSATRLVGLRKPPAITPGRSTPCSCCVFSRQLLIIVVDVIIINSECIRRG